MGNRVVLPSKNLLSDITISVDMTPLLISGEVVVSAAVLSATILGSDIAGNLLPVGVATVVRNVVYQQLSGGLAGVTYCIRITATTNIGNNLITLGDLSVTSDNTYGS